VSPKTVYPARFKGYGHDDNEIKLHGTKLCKASKRSVSSCARARTRADEGEVRSNAEKSAISPWRQSREMQMLISCTLSCRVYSLRAVFWSSVARLIAFAITRINWPPNESD